MGFVSEVREEGRQGRWGKYLLCTVQSSWGGGLEGVSVEGAIRPEEEKGEDEKRMLLLRAQGCILSRPDDSFKGDQNTCYRQSFFIFKGDTDYPIL